MPLCETKTWTCEDIDRAIAAVLITVGCPQCPSLLDMPSGHRESPIELIGQWTLSVGRSDVIVTVPALCLAHIHTFILRVDLWRRAKTPVGGLRVKSKIAPKMPTRPRPLLGI